MSNKKDKIEVIESGDIFFFYRPKVGSDRVKDLDDVQRFYMILAPENHKKKKNDKELFRLFLLGRKKLPEIIEGQSHSTERNWALNVMTTKESKDIERELLTPAEYFTETRGKRRLPAAIPTGEGKYSLVQHENHTELAYVLELPKRLGPSQKEFEIRKEASYIASVKNPDINIMGFAYFSERKPQYPEKVKGMFGDRRWIDADDPDLLNYENTQLLLIGARKKDVEEELGIDIDEEKENEGSAELFKELHVNNGKVPLKPLFEGRFPTEKEIYPVREKTEEEEEKVKQLSKEEAPGRGGKKSGRAAATSAPSAAAIAKILGGIDLPKKKDELLKYSEKNKPKVEDADEIIKAIRDLPSNKSYNTMAEVEKALSETR